LFVEHSSFIQKHIKSKPILLNLENYPKTTYTRISLYLISINLASNKHTTTTTTTTTTTKSKLCFFLQKKSLKENRGKYRCR
jgi:hypothetical protein